MQYIANTKYLVYTMNWMTQKRVGGVAVANPNQGTPVSFWVKWAGIVGLLFLALSMVPRFMSMNQATVTVFSNVPLKLADRVTSVTVGGEVLTPKERQGKQFSIFQGTDPADAEGGKYYWARLPSERFWKHAVYAVAVLPEGDGAKEEVLQVLVIPRLAGFLAALGGVLLLYSLPLLLSGDSAFWKSMITEGEGGYSLSKMQLLIWFFPTAAILFGLSAPQLQLTFNASMMVLLGMSGATTALGAAASPSKEELQRRKAKNAALAKGDPEVRALWTETIQPAFQTIIPSIKRKIQELRPALGTNTSELDSAVEGLETLSERVASVAGSENAAPGSDAPKEQADEPSLKDVVTDWQEQGDMTRYQYFLLALLGAVVVLASFAATLQVPILPSEFLGLLGLSQLAYVGTKGIKEFKASQS